MSEIKKPQTVYFIHPGLEHEVPLDEGEFEWDVNDHKRKFIKSRGKYLDITTEDFKFYLDGSIERLDLKKDDIYFWGEFEGKSKYKKIDSGIECKDCPNVIHEPIMEVKGKTSDEIVEQNKGIQNTDPYVCKGDRYVKS